MVTAKTAMRWALFGLYAWFFVWIGGCQSLLETQRNTWWLELILFHALVVGIALWLLALATDGTNILHDFPKKWHSLRKRHRRFSRAEMQAYHELRQRALEPPGDPESQFLLAMHYLEGTTPERKSKDEAMSLLQEAAKTGHTRALLTLYQAHRNAVDGRAAALSYLRQAAEAGDAESQNTLALELFIDKHPDRSEIAGWYRKAAQQGQREAAWSLGQHYEEGDGVPRSPDKALEWYRVAALQGHELAQQRVKLLSPKPEGN
jgi:hypothetical protein